MKTIFNTYINVRSQKQVDILKQVCIDNNLKIWDSIFAWKYFKGCIFSSDKESQEFWILVDNKLQEHPYQVTESEWLELLKQHQCTK